MTHHDDGDGEGKDRTLSLPIDWVWKLGELLLVVATLYFTLQMQMKASESAIKQQFMEHSAAIDKRIFAIEQDREMQKQVRDSQHREVQARLDSIQSDLRANNQAIESVDQFTQLLANDVRNLKGNAK